MAKSRKISKNFVEAFSEDLKGKKIFGANGKLLSSVEFSALLGLSVEEVDKWPGMGCPSVPDPRMPGAFLFDTAESLNWRFSVDINAIRETLDEYAPNIENDVEVKEATKRKAIADALLVELKLAKEQELVANIDDLLHNFRKANNNTRATLVSWKSRLPGLLAHIDEGEIAKILDLEIDDVLNNLMNGYHEYESSPS